MQLAASVILPLRPLKLADSSVNQVLNAFIEAFRLLEGYILLRGADYIYRTFCLAVWTHPRYVPAVFRIILKIKYTEPRWILCHAG